MAEAMDKSEESTRLCLSDIHVEFPGVKALNGVNLKIRAGECHALVGENGAGKSTLARVVIGETKPTKGRIFIEGTEVGNGYDIATAKKLGIAIVHQELQLVPGLNAVENVFVGNNLTRHGFVKKGNQRQLVSTLMDRLDLRFPIDIPVHHLRTAEQQIVQLMRALISDAAVIILDELTAVLPEDDIAKIFEIVRKLKKENKALIYISHRIDEIFEICDSYTVLTDGNQIESGLVRDINKDKLVELIAGRKLEKVFPEIDFNPGKELLKVDALTSESFRDVSLEVKEGEIVGIAGLVGAGKSELLRAIFGDLPTKSGTVMIGNQEIPSLSTRKLVKKGLGLIPDERKRLGLNFQQTLSENATICSLSQFKRFGFMNRREEDARSISTFEKLRLKYSSISQSPKSLSGGNQQKLVLAKWLIAGSDLLLFDEPTRGIDVGAKEEIYRLLSELVSQKKGILLVSPEIEELVGLCCRVYVMYEGALVKVVSGNDLNQRVLLENILGAKK